MFRVCLTRLILYIIADVNLVGFDFEGFDNLLTICRKTMAALAITTAEDACYKKDERQEEHTN